MIKGTIENTEFKWGDIDKECQKEQSSNADIVERKG